MPQPPMPPPWRAAVQREALLQLARSLSAARGGGLFSEALEAALRGLGATRGAAFEAREGTLELVAQEGLPPELRLAIEHLREDDRFFVAQEAAKSRRLAFDPELPTSLEGRVEPRALHASGWVAAVAVPVVVGREILGVLVVASAAPQVFSEEALAFVETVGHVVALAGAAARQDPARRDAGLDRAQVAQMAAVGLVAAGFAEELEAPTSALELVFAEQARVVAALEGALAGGLGPGEVSREAAARGSEEAREAAMALSDLVAEASATLERMKRASARVRAMTRKAPAEVLDLARVARDAVALGGSVFRARGVAVEANLERGASVRGRKDELVQAVFALLMNAAYAASAEAGRMRQAAEPRVVVHVSRSESRVVLAVEDSGEGVPASLRARIFEPFFSTREGGAGLGLALVRMAAVAHRGHVELATSDLGGAVFRLVLPYDAEAAEGLVTRGSLDSLSPPPSAKILWIDDDEMFLRSVRRALSDHPVVFARSAAAAAAALADREDPPALIFCDIGLPDRGGDELHAEIARTHPELAKRFIFVTGGGISAELADYLIASRCPTLLKPVKIDDVRAIIDGSGAAEVKLATVPTLFDRPTARPSKRELYSSDPSEQGSLRAPPAPRFEPDAQAPPPPSPASGPPRGRR